MALVRLDLIVNTVNVMLKITACSAFIITEMTLVRLDFIVNSVNMNPKITASRALIITERTFVKNYLIMYTLYVIYHRSFVRQFFITKITSV